MSDSRRNSLSPPTRTKTELQDPGAHELASDSEDHFSDAQSGPAESHPASPIPRTRVERVDDKPAYGEVPGTKAYSMREGDAEPDEIAFVPDPANKPGELEIPARSPTPGGQPIPKTVVEESPDSPGAVTHPETELKQKQRADPPPDLVLKADGQRIDNGSEDADTPISPSLKTPSSARSRRKSSLALERSPLSPSSPGRRSTAAAPFDVDDDDNAAGGGGGNDDEDDFGDDFDDFEEGGEDDDFDEFDDGFQQAEQTSSPPEQPIAEPTPVPAAATQPPPQPILSFPIPSFDDLDGSDIFAATEPYLNALFPSSPDDPSELLPLPPASRETNPIFLTPRSASLWSQLVAPPPLQPPDWIRSRIRRLFLVSLGVPVDLDEILPASKQKKLVLPSLLHRVSSNGSLRTSTDDMPRSRSLSRVRASGQNASSTSVDSQGNLKPSSKSKQSHPKDKSSARKGPPPEPVLDLVAAKQMCMTTDEALAGMTDKELKAHVARLEEMQGVASEVLVYWQKRTDEKIGDREAFEGVIENLVKHARKTRK
ncbi:hypothetical protein B0H66DRAFT_540003 [Apodospora peruviana]|uniref:Uncharacterized protein n=1 Tax=Apodospora peruviana TaxID=516989 RepID=A0AAE0MFE2_9PEZI|nr:hypothetical protein B0H66DRAFT_540003 [Apodospora peruviana]